MPTIRQAAQPPARSPNPCMFDTFITTPTITIPAGIPAGKIKIAFDSSWDHEGCDDNPVPRQQPAGDRERCLTTAAPPIHCLVTIPIPTQAHRRNFPRHGIQRSGAEGPAVQRNVDQHDV